MSRQEVAASRKISGSRANVSQTSANRKLSSPLPLL
jgi:hypothetical protein